MWICDAAHQNVTDGPWSLWSITVSETAVAHHRIKPDDCEASVSGRCVWGDLIEHIYLWPWEVRSRGQGSAGLEFKLLKSSFSNSRAVLESDELNKVVYISLSMFHKCISVMIIIGHHRYRCHGGGHCLLHVPVEKLALRWMWMRASEKSWGEMTACVWQWLISETLLLEWLKSLVWQDAAFERKYCLYHVAVERNDFCWCWCLRVPEDKQKE